MILAAFGGAQRVLESFGEGFHAGFGDVVGGVAGGRGDALFGAGVDDEARLVGGDHGGGEDLGAVDDAPEVGLDDAGPGAGRAEHVGAGLDGGVVHQHVDPAEAVQHGCLQRFEVGGAADVGGVGHDPGRGAVEGGAGEVGDADVQAEAGEGGGGGEADAGGAAGDDGDGAGL